MSSAGHPSMSSDHGDEGDGGDEGDEGDGWEVEPATTRRRSVLRSTIPYLLWNEFGERCA